MRFRNQLIAAVAVVGLVSWLGAGVAFGSYTVTATCTSDGQAAACSAGWYTSNVAISWTWSPNDGGNPTSGCLPHSYAQDTQTSASCTVAGPSGLGGSSQPINLETSSPTASVAPSRPPDSNGWYNHPLAFLFTGSSFSGIASCTPSASYSGPDSAGTAVRGSCTDNAGKTVGATSSPFAYDADPSLSVTTDRGDHTVMLSWAMADIAPLESIEIVRSPGLHRRKESLVYSGQGVTFRDRHVRAGIRYRYTLTARDQAGNTIVSNVAVKPGPRLLAPANGARVTTPPLLRWTPVRGASYYNVQLYQGATKVLSAWPSHARLQLQRSWFYQRLRRLRAGRYRWYVWPGFGLRRVARYGRAIGSRTFVVTHVA